MIRKFATVSAFGLAAVLITILAAAATLQAQQTEPQPPATQPQTQQQPDQQSSQEPSTEELGTHKKKPKDYKNWSFNVGGGASLTNGTTEKYVRGGGEIAAAGVARNYSKYFGFRLDFQWDNLPLRASALQSAQAPSANNHAYLLNLDPIINIPATKNWGGYIVGGLTFLHRSGKLDSSTAVPGSACNGFFIWWGHCYAGSLPVNGNFLHSSQNEFGENFGFGLTRKIHGDMDFYAEFRIEHGSYNSITTDFRPITIGVRW